MTNVEPIAPERVASEMTEGERRLSAMRHTGGGSSVKNGSVTSAVLGGEQSTVSNTFKRLFQQYENLAYQLPWEVLDYVELLATYNPDYSQAVENIKMLANSGHELFVTASSQLQTTRTKDYLEGQARKVQESHGGIDGVIDKLLDQAATFGAMCGEWVLNDELTEIVDFVDISPKKIRFFWLEEEQRFAPFQKVTGQQAKEAEGHGQEVRNNCVRLNELTFRYYAFDAAPESPYGTPPFLAALENIAIQRDMVHNMAQIVKKLGLLGIIDLTIERMEALPGETDSAYAARCGAYIDAYKEIGERMAVEGGIIHFDDVAASTWQIGGNAAGATNIHKANEEMVFSGLKSMPSVQGRSYCVVPNTRILTADLRWVRAGDLALGDELIGFDEDLGKGRGKGSVAKMRRSVVEVNKRIRLDCVKVITDKGAITVSKQHPLVAMGNRMEGRVWRQAADLVPGDLMPWIGEPWEVDRSYESGYLAGMFDGEGTLGRSGSGMNGTVTMAQREGVVLDETVMCLKELGFVPSVGPPTGGTHSDVCMVRILGGKFETLRFLGSVRPHRLLKKAHMTWEGAAIRNGGSGSVNQTGRKDAYATVLAVEPVGRREVVALQTSTRTFIAEGLLNHNSTTETYAGVAYDIIIRNTRKYQRAAKRMIESGYWLMVTLAGLQPDKITLSFNENRSLNRLQEAQAQKTEIQNAFMKWLLGIIDQVGVSHELGYSEPKQPMDTPPESLIGIASAHGIDSVPQSDFEVPPTTRDMLDDEKESEDEERQDD